MTVVVVAVVVVPVLVLVGGAAVASAVTAAHRARSAADLAVRSPGQGALLARGRPWARPAARAADLMGRNGAQLTACAVVGDDSVVVSCEAPIGLRLPAGPGTAKARSRAGPSP